jgi:hypothetical protein
MAEVGTQSEAPPGTACDRHRRRRDASFRDVSDHTSLEPAGNRPSAPGIPNNNDLGVWESVPIAEEHDRFSR